MTSLGGSSQTCRIARHSHSQTLSKRVMTSHLRHASASPTVCFSSPPRAINSQAADLQNTRSHVTPNHRNSPHYRPFPPQRGKSLPLDHGGCRADDGMIVVILSLSRVAVRSWDTAPVRDRCALRQISDNIGIFLAMVMHSSTRRSRNLQRWAIALETVKVARSLSLLADRSSFNVWQRRRRRLLHGEVRSRVLG
ncbi:hypothetical protein TIFTF001_021658 [Ficus carica]|uniref:Uncharacterized protein n=1 Tax=Ficus carica TaxID=3494 RepID=A0AA88AYZ1_FICCA|nr:hypothetical protein TIFTF001_021658 [Ficus carica]